MDDRIETPETFPKRNLQKVIWIVCLAVLLQVGWMGWRLYSFKIREKENLRISEDRKIKRREKAEEELKSVPEPEIYE